CSWLPLRLNLPAMALFLFSELRREGGTKVVRLEDLANLDFGAAVERRALEPLDRLFFGPDLPEPEAGDELFGLGERTVCHGPFRAVEHDARALGARLKPFGGEHDPGFHQVFVVLAHCR